MKIGTKSVLFGAHAFWAHPFFVALAWWKLYGFPWDPRLWVAFFVHDLGYWGKPNMDGEEGEEHPYWGACVLGVIGGKRWYYFALLHSRYLAKKLQKPYSRLCVADKLAIALEPWWLYLPRVMLTGEIREYMDLAEQRSRVEPHWARDRLAIQRKRGRRRGWFMATADYCRKWAYEHRDGREDTWTPAGGGRSLRDAAGTWK